MLVLSYTGSHSLTLCMLGIFLTFLSSADFFSKLIFKKNLSGIPSECQTDGSRSGPTFHRA